MNDCTLEISEAICVKFFSIASFASLNFRIVFLSLVFFNLNSLKFRITRSWRLLSVSCVTDVTGQSETFFQKQIW